MPLNARFRIARPGWPMISLGLLVAAIGVLPVGRAIQSLTAALGLGFSGFCAYFFRDPDRVTPVDRDLLYSPGDGRVLSVGREEPGDTVTIRIFLSLFDVHVQRMPCSGVVDRVQYQRGAFHMAMKKEARDNERNLLRVRPEGNRPAISVEQIAGFLARRIECWVREEDTVTAGARYGMIRFGSQVALHLPPQARPVVRPGDRVIGAVTPVARWTS